MKKLQYEEENNKDGIVVFGINIGIFILSFVFIFCILYSVLFQSGNAILCVVLSVIFSYFIAKRYSNKKTLERNIITEKYNNIKNNGEKYEGEIIKIIKNKYLDTGAGDSGGGIIERYSVVIKYLDSNNNIKEYETPELNFNPNKDLGSNKCSVYDCNGNIYVTDFISKKDGDTPINLPNIEICKNFNEEYYKKSIKILWIIAAIIFGVILCVAYVVSLNAK